VIGVIALITAGSLERAHVLDIIKKSFLLPPTSSIPNAFDTIVIRNSKLSLACRQDLSQYGTYGTSFHI
jgi:hypothetical protein